MTIFKTFEYMVKQKFFKCAKTKIFIPVKELFVLSNAALLKCKFWDAIIGVILLSAVISALMFIVAQEGRICVWNDSSRQQNCVKWDSSITVEI